MKPKLILGWILVIVGLLFLVSGLVVTIFANVPISASGNTVQSDQAVPASFWVELANNIMDFTLQLLAMEWTPIRVGVFLIVVGMVLEGVGVYSLMTSTT